MFASFAPPSPRIFQTATAGPFHGVATHCLRRSSGINPAALMGAVSLLADLLAALLPGAGEGVSITTASEQSKKSP
jgi:hypothetical protein